MSKQKMELCKENRELILAVIKAKEDLEIANRNFEHSNDTELVDYYSYQIKASKVRYDYLLKIIKEKGIMLDVINNFNIKYNKQAI